MALKFIRMAVLYAFVGIGLGIYMAASHSFSQHSTHAHANLLGWVSSAIFGLIYQVFPELGRHQLATAHFYLHSVGLPIIISGVFLIYSNHGDVGEPLASIGSIVISLGFIALGINVFRNTPAE
ncbi:MAG: cytochrome-c oxidase [Methylovulum sp.]|jgi:cbb3-type cytochrome oxidase subunit 1|nr:MAG: cytochrome-c oxidase [Methylovulum sp.]